VVFAAYFVLSVRMALRIGQAVRRANEDIYADSDDFPVRFAQYIQWLPTCICVLMAINFYADNAIVKAVRDVIFTGMNIWFCIFTLNPWRQPYAAPSERTARPVTDDEPETAPAAGNFRLTDERFEQLSEKLDLLLTKERIFTEQHITSDTLTARLGTNATYLSEVIRRSGYQSFYDMISQHRVRYAISLIHQHPDSRLADIAEQCGFSSQASMTKAFKAQGKATPSSYRAN
jgi:AraC-like DNA-binding protein